ncbi:dihydropteroate synthase [Halocatena pleomorpha]|uniref:Probable bifunctional folylpolyglutamate synthase/dihydropteroate synthase n=1 Tax=Halocatena pleomorpha TaxID=1785090 RepID=A0A3P3RA96_9EURY|nr:dihydropteroate synthase [Halocatena pleomorpha]RRJ30334.1 dihydropteroate synthase [Halocatena pleomorpha]
MEYYEAANFLFDLKRYPSRKGTEATRALLAAMDDPHEELTCVQIAGSNGKGSTARMVERVLREAGLSVGLFTSPHLTDVRERVRVNGRKIRKQAVTAFVSEIREYVLDASSQGAAPTFFETQTALALWEFARQDVDIAVLEVGIGGHHDATSVVDPLTSAVTSVTLEHTALLGDTRAEIARDKAHVAGELPLVTGESEETLAAIRSVAGEVHTVGSGSDTDVQARYEGRDGLTGTVTLTGSDWSVAASLPQLGAHQAVNAGIAAALCRQVADVTEQAIVRGLETAYWPGRFEIMSQEPLLVLDGAHNPGSCATTAETLDSFDYDELHLVFGALSDKDHRGMAETLPEAATVYACEPSIDRAEDADALVRAFDTDSTRVVRSVVSAVESALDAAAPEDCVLVVGSLYTVSEARQRWVGTQTPKRVSSIADARAALTEADVTQAGVWRMRGKGVHRVVKLRLQPRQARFLKEELLSLGGECAISGCSSHTHEPRYLDVVAMGTLAQFKRLIEKLDGQPHGLAVVGDDLKQTLDIGTAPEKHGYPWDDRVAVMGIVNVTPDSFHDGGAYDTVEAAVARAEELIEDGADILDIGGESTRPGADPVPTETEIERVVPVIERLADRNALVSVDTRKAAVARAALEAGADILNDVSGLADPDMRHVAADYNVPTVVMHSIEAPVDPETDVTYDDVVSDTIDELAERVLLAEKAGLDRDQIIVDPGIGFGTSATESFELLGRVGEFHALGCPVLVGHSHKSMYDRVDRAAGERLHATVAATAIAAERGADIVRVHDVKENVAAVRTQRAASDPDA